jgi:cbb3-type cytochrome oxidase maturation protein
MICSICIAGGFLLAYLWSVKKGQFDDLEADGFRILMEHKPASNREKSKINSSKNK